MNTFSLTLMYSLLACIDRWNIFNRLVIARIFNTATGVQCLCYTSEKASLSSGFFAAHRLLPAFAATNRAIYIFLLLQTSEKTICQVSVPVETIIPWSNDSMFMEVVALRYHCVTQT